MKLGSGWVHKIRNALTVSRSRFHLRPNRVPIASVSSLSQPPDTEHYPAAGNYVERGDCLRGGDTLFIIDPLTDRDSGRDYRFSHYWRQAG
jgi:hypothetical protein